VLRLLARPRWVAFTLVTVLAGVAFFELGQWQLRRHEERAAYNEAAQTAQRTAPVPVEQLTGAGRAPAARDEWRRVQASGRYDADRTLLVRNRTYQGQVGYWVLTPLLTGPGPGRRGPGLQGPGLLVNRGWVPAGATARTVPDFPSPPPGQVTLTGRLRLPEDGDDPVFAAPRGQVTYVDVPRIASRLPYPVYGAYVELVTQRPPPAGLRRLPPPELSAGPHLAYAVQWFLFIGVGAVGWWALLRREARDQAARHGRVEHTGGPGSHAEPSGASNRATLDAR
jgi:cytochrome oxidase assembly protein ShyY1